MSKDAISLETYNELVQTLYDAANDPTRWDDFLALLARVLNGHGVSLRIVDPQSYFPKFSVTHGYDEAFTQDYSNYYYQSDITIPLLANQTAGTVQTRAEKMLDKNFLSTEFYQDFARKWGCCDILGSYFIKQADCWARIGVHRDERRPRFSEEDKQVIRLLLPHLQRAFHISRRIQTIKAQKESSNDVLDHLPFGIVFVDETGKPVVVNQEAELISKQAGGISIKADGLAAETSQETQTLNHLIQQAIQGQQGKAYQGGAFSIARANSLLPLSVIVTPHHSVQPIFGFLDSRVAAIIFISDPGKKLSISPVILSALYGLTKAEARLATELAQGRNLDDIADTYQLSKHTLRSQLKTIFSKTGLKSQSDLIRLILGGPAILNL